MKPFHLEIVTPDGAVFDGEAESLLVHTDDGDAEILAGHADYFASVATGRARILTSQGERLASCSGGFLSVNKAAVKLVAITFEFADEIDVQRARLAKERAELAIEKARDERDVRVARAKLARAMSRINIAERR